LCVAQIDTGHIAIKLPPLNTLLDTAYKTSPLLKVQEQLLNKKKILTSIEKKSWLKAVSITGNYSRGTNNAQIDGNLIPTYTTTVTNLYGAGFSLNLSLATILNRKKVISVSKINYEMEKYLFEDKKRELRKLIVELYSAVLLSQKVLEIISDGLTISDMNYSYAEIEYKNNTMSLADFSKVHAESLRTKVYYEEAKREYLLSIVTLEETVGIKIR